MSSNNSLLGSIKGAVAGMFHHQSPPEVVAEDASFGDRIGNPALEGSPVFIRTISSPQFGEKSHLRPRDQAERAWTKNHGEAEVHTGPSGNTQRLRTRVTEGVDTIREKISEGVDTIKEGAFEAKEKLGEGLHRTAEKLGLVEQASPTLHETVQHRKLRKQASPTPEETEDIIESFSEADLNIQESLPIVVQPTIGKHGLEQNLTASEISEPAHLAKKHSVPIVTQPIIFHGEVQQIGAENLHLNTYHMEVPLCTQPTMSTHATKGVHTQERKAVRRASFKPAEAWEIPLSFKASEMPANLFSTKSVPVKALAPLSSKFLEARRQIPTLLRAKKVTRPVKKITHNHNVVRPVRHSITHRRPSHPATTTKKITKRKMNIKALRPLSNRFLEARRQLPHILKAKKVTRPIGAKNLGASHTHAEIKSDFNQFMRKVAPATRIDIVLSFKARKMPAKLFSHKKVTVKALRPLSSRFLEARRQLPHILKAKKVTRPVGVDNRPLSMKIQNAGQSAARLYGEIKKEFNQFMTEVAPRPAKPAVRMDILLAAPKAQRPTHLFKRAGRMFVRSLRPISSKFLEARRQIPQLLRAKIIAPTFNLDYVGQPAAAWEVSLSFKASEMPANLFSTKSVPVKALAPISSKFLEARRQIPTLLRARKVVVPMGTKSLGASHTRAEIKSDFNHFMRKAAPASNLDYVGQPAAAWEVPLSFKASEMPANLFSTKRVSVKALAPISSKFLEARRQIPTLLKARKVTKPVREVQNIVQNQWMDDVEMQDASYEEALKAFGRNSKMIPIIDHVGEQESVSTPVESDFTLGGKMVQTVDGAKPEEKPELSNWVADAINKSE